MIFSELYSAYYNAVAHVIEALLDGERDEKALRAIISEYAFEESAACILPALHRGRWQLLKPDMTPTLQRRPTMPMTLVEKQWLKAVSLDPRVRLFDVSFDLPKEIPPLYTEEDYLIYDRYGDGDPYEDAHYVENFRFLLAAIRERKPIRLTMTNRNGKEVVSRCTPLRLEYSEKDDKFRLLTGGCNFLRTVNLARITSVSYYSGPHTVSDVRRETHYESVKLLVKDERNALERVMLHFAHFEKEAERIGAREYLLTVRYDREDETELVIRVLSFGPLVSVTDSPHFSYLLRERLKAQYALGLGRGK